MAATNQTDVAQVPQETTASVAEQQKGWNTIFRSQLKKTVMCRYYAKGKCRFGPSCQFAHSDAELKQLPDLSKTKVCLKFMEGKCPLEASECPYAHGRDELRRTPAYEKKKRSKMAAPPSETSPLQHPEPPVDHAQKKLFGELDLDQLGSPSDDETICPDSGSAWVSEASSARSRARSKSASKGLPTPYLPNGMFHSLFQPGTGTAEGKTDMGFQPFCPNQPMFYQSVIGSGEDGSAAGNAGTPMSQSQGVSSPKPRMVPMPVMTFIPVMMIPPQLQASTAPIVSAQV
mmetsp:Transcript_10483/g.23813  ORF Transcript_10483/g.23813 Transcript_10483/m.23813 type:complete len:288 (-) Transcript_10483:122-985(-)|eukprot:CAMPEP_0178423514 /NCGR_PEP_ID=MMETSP0689_2-20121128/27727_1 /TAXON_ID=160604 /ORGANISM="Amphidinium massartii, Strain CS-259" /LENGTH=287 /DNA_ID=CAMNT_0020045109 /DNA_START=154 /DNA_END=1017 /DNA_ORIENTATION=+